MRSDDDLDTATGGSAEMLLDLVYDQLKAIAQHRFADERLGHTLQPTALVHEAYMRLAGDGKVRWNSRAHFLGAAAEAMRRILIEHARARSCLKRGGDGVGQPAQRSACNLLDFARMDDPAKFLALDEAICRVRESEPQVGELIRMRFYAGLNMDDCAEVLGISPRQADRLWAYSRARLFQLLKDTE